ncbi:unnamed protein product [Urochloa humidicola]
MIFEYIGRKHSTADLRRRLELVRRLEKILYAKFPDMNDYYNMMKGPIEPQLQYALKTLCAQNQQNQQNPQMARGMTSSFATMTPDVNHVPDSPRTPLLFLRRPRTVFSSPSPGRRGSSGFGVAADADGGSIPQHQLVQDMALTAMDQQFVMLRTGMCEKIFEYIERRQLPGEWRRRLPKLARRLEDILYTKFPNRNDYYNMMKGPVEPQVQYAIKTLRTQNQQNRQNPQMARDTASSSATVTPDVNHVDLHKQSASLPADVQNNNADELNRTE